jgi:hypothetical protein
MDKKNKELLKEIEKIKQTLMWHELLYHPSHYIVRRKMNEILPDPLIK